MTSHKLEKYVGQTILLDGHEYIGCDFVDCTIVIRCEQPHRLDECRFLRAQWKLEGPALQMVGLLKAWYAHGGLFLRFLVEDLVRQIRGEPQIPFQDDGLPVPPDLGT